MHLEGAWLSEPSVRGLLSTSSSGTATSFPLSLSFSMCPGGTSGRNFQGSCCCSFSASFSGRWRLLLVR